MTDAKKREALKRLIERHTDEKTVSREVARESLIREGIYDRAGRLRTEFGGGAAKKKTAAA